MNQEMLKLIDTVESIHQMIRDVPVKPVSETLTPEQQQVLLMRAKILQDLMQLQNR